MKMRSIAVAACLIFLISCTQNYDDVPTDSVWDENHSVIPADTMLPTSTEIPLPTETLLQPIGNELGGYYFFYENHDYGFLTSFGNIIDMKTNVNEFDYLVFSNFSNRLAFWIQGNPSQLWISDLRFENPQLIFEDVDGNFASEYVVGRQLGLQWTPDDLHLIIDATHSSSQDYIYHVESGEIERWNFDCEHTIIEISPRTERLAFMCPSSLVESDTAVIEYGGEVWIWLNSPWTPIIEKHPYDPNRRWQWSPSGEAIALVSYADGAFYILDQFGNPLVTLPDRAYWLDDFGPYFLWESTVFWSPDGKYLMIYAVGRDDSECLPWHTNRPIEPFGEIFYTGRDIYTHVACWQVIDPKTGEKIWSTSDLTDYIETSDFPDLTAFTPLSFFYPIITEDENYLMIPVYTEMIRGVFIVDLRDTNRVNFVPDVEIDKLR